MASGTQAGWWTTGHRLDSQQAPQPRCPYHPGTKSSGNRSRNGAVNILYGVSFSSSNDTLKLLRVLERSLDIRPSVMPLLAHCRD
jgi:hypothetical protein